MPRSSKKTPTWILVQHMFAQLVGPDFEILNVKNYKKIMKALFAHFLGCLYGKYFKNRFPKWKWHYSASRGTGQIQIWRMEVPNTSIFIIFGSWESVGALMCESVFTELLQKTGKAHLTSRQNNILGNSRIYKLEKSKCVFQSFWKMGLGILDF